MTAEHFEVIVDLQVTDFAGESYPVIMVTLPSSLDSTMEILGFQPERVVICPNGETLQVCVGDVPVTELDDRNGNLATFKSLLDKQHMFALTVTAADKDRAGQMFILTRTLIVENLTGTVVSNSGPKKMSYEEACQGSEDSPEAHATGRSFCTAVELAVAMRNEDKKPKLRLVD